MRGAADDALTRGPHRLSLAEGLPMSTTPRRLAALLVAAAAGARPTAARAQGAAPAAPPAAAPPAAAPAAPALPAIAAGDSARPESVERLIAVAYPEQTHRQVMDQTIRAMVRSNPMFASAEPALREFFTKHMSYAALRADQARVFRETYTEAEVQDLARFYASDIGRRFLAKMPVVMARSQELAAQRMQTQLPELMALLQQQMGGRP